MYHAVWMRHWGAAVMYKIWKDLVNVWKSIERLWKCQEKAWHNGKVSGGEQGVRRTLEKNLEAT
jgi:hypothetical protein